MKCELNSLRSWRFWRLPILLAAYTARFSRPRRQNFTPRNLQYRQLRRLWTQYTSLTLTESLIGSSSVSSNGGGGMNSLSNDAPLEILRSVRLSEPRLVSGAAKALGAWFDSRCTQLSCPVSRACSPEPDLGLLLSCYSFRVCQQCLSAPRRFPVLSPHVPRSAPCVFAWWTRTQMVYKGKLIQEHHILLVTNSSKWFTLFSSLHTLKTSR